MHGKGLGAGQKSDSQEWMRGRFFGLGRIRCSRVGCDSINSVGILGEQNRHLREFKIKGNGGVSLLLDFATQPFRVIQTRAVSVSPYFVWFCCLKYVSPSMTIMLKSKEA